MEDRLVDMDSGRENRVGKREKLVLRNWKWRRDQECFLKTNDLMRIGGNKVAKVLSMGTKTADAPL